MEETYLLNVEGVKKKILHGGQGELPKFQDGSKITFHFQTLKDDFERTVIDDSREAGMPMEIIVGKMFKLEIWETLLSSMRAGEVAEFWCDAIHTGMYALVAKGMRRIVEGRDPLEGQKHRCGMGNMFDYHSTGYADLDELQRTPQPLIFIMELFRVEEPWAYKRDTWAMSKEEKLAAVPVLHSEGNRLVLRKEFRQAAEKYQEAVICLRNLQAKEKPWEEAWLKLESLVTPLVLNYCQCQLELGEYYEVLEHTTELLQKHHGNAKAHFKRAKAHAAVWNEREAREDFARAAHLDPAMAAAVKKELKLLGERMRKKHVEERKRYRALFQAPRAMETAPAGSEQPAGAHGAEPGSSGQPGAVLGGEKEQREAVGRDEMGRGGDVDGGDRGVGMGLEKKGQEDSAAAGLEKGNGEQEGWEAAGLGGAVEAAESREEPEEAGLGGAPEAARLGEALEEDGIKGPPVEAGPGEAHEEAKPGEAQEEAGLRRAPEEERLRGGPGEAQEEAGLRRAQEEEGLGEAQEKAGLRAALEEEGLKGTPSEAGSRESLEAAGLRGALEEAGLREAAGEAGLSRGPEGAGPGGAAAGAGVGEAPAQGAPKAEQGAAGPAPGRAPGPGSPHTDGGLPKGSPVLEPGAEPGPAGLDAGSVAGGGGKGETPPEPSTGAAGMTLQPEEPLQAGDAEEPCPAAAGEGAKEEEAPPGSTGGSGPARGPEEGQDPGPSTPQPRGAALLGK